MKNIINHAKINEAKETQNRINQIMIVIQFLQAKQSALVQELEAKTKPFTETEIQYYLDNERTNI